MVCVLYKERMLILQAPAKKTEKVANPIFAATPKNFRIGGDVLVRI